MTLTGRVALVTGGARGIGAAIADALAADGASVAIGDLDGVGATETASRVAKERGVPTLGVEMDITSRESIDAAVAEVERVLGPIAALVNNAGIDIVKPFVESTADEWERIIAVNLVGMLHCCQSVLPGMIERGDGAIVSLASDAARVGSSGEAVYSATKGGVVAFSKALARETARNGIRVNCVCPGPTDTALLDQIGEANPRLREALARSIPMKRIGEPEDVAPTVVFLAGDGARYMTGQTISVSGGLTMA
ncbi:MAG: 2-hydroxycyclohexanecarboxyl-CoA dehydrogenase [Actinomycetota bacterium]|nr:2-hydroxycyclohexanecarboxyl-CoA dehydrogenase [Actinomycetota bacterium]